MTIGLRDIYGVSQIGVLGGGTAGQTLVKQSATDGDFDWGDVDALPAGGTTGQVLAKQSATDGDADWENGPISVFDATATYAANDIVLQGGNLYRAKAAVAAGAFDSNEWDQIAPAPAATPTFLAKSMAGLSTFDLDASMYEMFDLTNIDTALTLSIVNMQPGQSILIVLTDAATNGVTFSDPILWVQGIVPAFSDQTDSVVITQVTGKKIANFGAVYK